MSPEIRLQKKQSPPDEHWSNPDGEATPLDGEAPPLLMVKKDTIALCTLIWKATSSWSVHP